MQSLRWYAPVRQSKYPHFRRSEATLWNEFIVHNPHNLKRVAFDVTVGQGRKTLIPSDRNLQKDWEYLSSFKVDALGLSSFGYILYELKEDCNASAFGQLLVYDALLRRDSPSLVPFKRCVISKGIHQDLYFPASIYSIELIDLLFFRQIPLNEPLFHTVF